MRIAKGCVRLLLALSLSVSIVADAQSQAASSPPPAAAAPVPPGTGPVPPGAAPAGSDQQPPPLSKDCTTPGVTMSGAIPLPKVQNALTNRKVIKILTIGASSSALMRNNSEHYFGMIEQVLEKAIPGVDIQIIDRGVSGELARDAADRMKAEVALTEPDLVLWQSGGPDALARVPVDEFEDTVEKAIVWLKGHGIDAAIVGMQYVRSLAKDANYQAIRAALTRVAERNQVLRISRYEAMQVIEQSRQLASGEKLNEFAVSEQGYACLSEYVVRAITTGIFLRQPKAK